MSQITQTGQPIVVLKEGSSQTKGREAQRNNFMAAKLIADVIKSSLGPQGMDKMLVDGLGDVTITNDGATILKEIDVQHPAAKMMVEIAKTTDSEVGDGTTSAVVLAGALITKAEELVNKGVHPTIIVDGYAKSADKALDILENIAIKIDPTDKTWLTKIATTSMQTKLVSEDAPHLSKLIVYAITQIAEKVGETYEIDLDNIKVEKKPGGSLSDTTLITGMVLDKEVVHSGMPKSITNAKIALLNAALEIEKTEISAEIRISDPTQMKSFMDEENRLLKTMVEKVSAAGANVLLCQKGLDDIAQHYLAKEGILTVRRVKESDMTKLSKATGARLVTNLEDLTAEDLGEASLVEERKVEEDKWVFIEGCKNPKAVTLLIRGGSQRIIDESDRSIHDALMVTKDVLEQPAVLAGGGSPEEEISHQLREWSSSLSGREQLAVQMFAAAIEKIPLTLAENAGLDPIDSQVELRAKHSDGKTWWGIDITAGGVGDLSESNIYEPLKVKTQIIKSASEAANMILRIDDVISSGKSAGPPPGAEGMGGM